MAVDLVSLAGKPVRRIGFGAMQLPGARVFGPPRDRGEALALLRRAVELGVNHIDTAQYYGPDVSNELIHAALYPYPEDLALVSKVGAMRDSDGAWLAAQRPSELRRGVEENLRSLELERIDVVNLRLIGEDHAHDAPVVEFQEQLETMLDLQAEGKIAGIGLSNITLEQLETALELTAVACVQNPLNVLQRDDCAVLEYCRARGIPYVPFFPLGSAFAGQQHVSENQLVREHSERLHASCAQVALAWLLQHAANILLIPGTSSLAHLEENIAAQQLELDAEAIAALDAIDG